MDIFELAKVRILAGGKGSGGVSSWNDLKDRPFGEETVNLGDTLTWDGTPSDVFIDLVELAFHHVSDSTPTPEEVNGGTFVSSTGLEHAITEESIYQDEEAGAYILSGTWVFWLLSRAASHLKALHSHEKASISWLWAVTT